MKKRLLVTVLMLLLAFSFLTAFPASAAETGGAWGNLTWKFDESSGTLTISGQGAMIGAVNFDWHAYRNSTKTLVIGEGVTSVAEGAFIGYTALTSVSLPSTMRTIGINAFQNCGLTQIDLKNVTAIKSNAFTGCGMLSAVTIPAGVKTLERGAFSHCINLASVTLPEGLTKIDSDVFSLCQNLTAIDLPDALTVIESGAFSSTGLTEITLPASLITLGSNAFSNCQQLKQIRIPDKVTQIQNFTFSGCTALTEIYLGKSVQSVANEAFQLAAAMKKFTVSSENPYLSADEAGILYNKAKTELLMIPYGFSGSYSICPGTSKIAPWAAAGCQALTEIILPEGVQTICRCAFQNCKNLKKVTVSEGLKVIETQAFQSSGITKIVFPSSLTEIGSIAFANCKGLKEISFLGDMPKIDDGSFDGVNAVTTYSCSKNWGDLLDNRGSYIHFGGYLGWTSADFVAETVPGQEATCTTSGYTESIVCKTCGKVSVPATYIQKKSHNYTQKEILDDTSHRFTCADCGYAVTGAHSMSAKVVRKPTCIAEGRKQHSCLECDYAYIETLPIEEKAHVYDHGCDPDCNECGAKRETEHVFGKKWASDSENHWQECLVCGLVDNKAPHGEEPVCGICGYEKATPPTDPMEPTEPAGDAPQPSSETFPWWLIPLGLAATAVVVLIVIKKRKTA